MASRPPGPCPEDSGGVGRPSRDPEMAKTSPFEFLQQVRAEAAKVTWPTRKETLVTTGMVFVMVIIASIFFLIADQIIHWLIGLVLGIGR